MEVRRKPTNFMETWKRQSLQGLNQNYRLNEIGISLSIMWKRQERAPKTGVR